MRVNDLIRQRRMQKGWTQQELSEKSGVNISTLRRYERGEVHEPNPETVEKIRKTLEIQEPLKDLIYSEKPGMRDKSKMYTLAVSRNGTLFGYMSIPDRWIDPSVKYDGVVVLNDAFQFRRGEILILADEVEKKGDFVWCNENIYKVIRPGISCVVETPWGDQTLLPQGEPYGIVKFSFNKVQ